MIGFKLFNGANRNAGELLKEQSGGGVWCEATNCLLINCFIISNTAAQYGGGTYSGALSNCTSFRNSAGTGGGAFGGIPNSCTLSTNAASNGGGCARQILYNLHNRRHQEQAQGRYLYSR